MLNRTPALTNGDVMSKRNPVPEELCSRAMVLGGSRARTWGDEPPPWTDEWFATPREELHAQHRGIVGCEHNYLAISGGGANGAFGAGLLTGWTRNGTRPEFTAVTGISTGALAAPFAFLGPAWDHQLKQVFTTFSTKDLIKKTPLSAVTSSAIYSTKGLQGVIARFFDETVLEAVATEFRDKGRQLSIGTTNLDALRPVIWNIGRIAASGHPDALQLIRKVMLASLLGREPGIGLLNPFTHTGVCLRHRQHFEAGDRIFYRHQSEICHNRRWREDKILVGHRDLLVLTRLEPF